MIRFGQQSSATAGVVLLSVCTCSVTAFAQTPGSSSNSPSALQLEEVVVSARRRDESLQSVPDAVTAFTADTIVNAGIQELSEFAALTPNLTFHDSSAYRAGQFHLSMRGIGNGQEGWPSVSYIVDGVPADSLDSIASGSLEDIERIEVLRGPQSALYGFNALAGAINVVTKRPTNDLTGGVRVQYGKGDDRQIAGTISGPIIDDKLLFRVAAGYRDADGLIDSTSNGIDLDFRREDQVRARLTFRPTDDVEIDLHGAYLEQRNGAGYLDRIPSFDYFDNFSSAFGARRGFGGQEDRTLSKLALKAQWDFDHVSLISVTGYSDTDQSLNTSICYDDPSEPLYPAAGGGDVCLFTTFGAPPAFGSQAPPGAPVDYIYDGEDNLRSVTSDIRLASHDTEAVEWTIGVSALYRKYTTGYDSVMQLAPAGRAILPGLSNWNTKRDNWWGVYGQVNWNATSRLELTAAARYDEEIYKNTAYTSRSFDTVVPVPSPDGTLESTQREEASAFQPKGQISFQFTDDVLGYATISRGFRAGYFITGTYTLPEETTNYEVGLKSTWFDRRVLANVAVFHIDYSDQQFESLSPEFPFRSAVTIPETDIKGIELESTWLVSSFLTLGLGLGYLDATVADGGGQAPDTPRFNGNVSADFSYPLGPTWQARLHIDDRYNSSQYLSPGEQQRVPAKNYLNLRAGVRSDRYEIAAFMRNATDTRQATLAGIFIPGFGAIRYQNEPRSYGVEVRASF